jgi:hypothetical protein
MPRPLEEARRLLRDRRRRKVCAFCADKTVSIDYKEVNRLRRYRSGRRSSRAGRPAPAPSTSERSRSPRSGPGSSRSAVRAAAPSTRSAPPRRSGDRSPRSEAELREAIGPRIVIGWPCSAAASRQASSARCWGSRGIPDRPAPDPRLRAAADHRGRREPGLRDHDQWCGRGGLSRAAGGQPPARDDAGAVHRDRRPRWRDGRVPAPRARPGGAVRRAPRLHRADDGPSPRARAPRHDPGAAAGRTGGRRP